MEIVVGLLTIAVLVLVIYVVWLKTQESSRAAAYGQNASAEAHLQFQNWRASELASIHTQQAEIAQREASVHLARWKSDYEQSIRQEAVKKSHEVITGKVTEQLVPYLPSFRYNPRDARFIGSPVDFIVFDGLSAGEVKQVVFIEVKTGGAGLSKREKQVRSAVDTRSVKWEELRIVSEVPLSKPNALSASLGSTGDDLVASRIYNAAESYRVGETLSHQTLGKGRVIAVQHNKIEVQFLTEGIKYLVHKSF